MAQWLACWAHNPKVPGSKPGSAMLVANDLLTMVRSPLSRGYGATAARLTPDQKVGSLNLAALRTLLRRSTSCLAYGAGKDLAVCRQAWGMELGMDTHQSIYNVVSITGPQSL